MRRVIVLGAGASHGCSASGDRLPLTADLLHELIENRYTQRKATLRIVATALDRFCGREVAKVNAEAFLTWLELERGSFVDYSFTNESRSYFREELEEALQTVLGSVPEKVIPTKSDRAFWRFWCEVTLFCFKHYIAEFIADVGGQFESEQHQSVVKRLTPADTVITFNWDLYVERALSALVGYAVPSYLMVGLNTYQNILKSEGFIKDDPQIKQELPRWIKLHGSIDWIVRSTLHHYGRIGRPWLLPHRGREHQRYPPGPQWMIVGSVPKPLGEEPKGEWVEEEGFWLLEEPCIIPPILEKEVYLRRNSLFHEQWEKAFYTLASADQILLVGYSLPPTDQRAVWLFRASCLANPTLKRVGVVALDPNALCGRLREENIFAGAPVVEVADSFERFATADW